jgi:cytochrome c oxidase assembly factor CtaG
MIAPMKLRDFENAMIFRTHKAVGRALFTVAPMLLRCETTELAVRPGIAATMQVAVLAIAYLPFLFSTVWPRKRGRHVDGP